MTSKSAPRRPRKTDGKLKGAEWTRNRGRQPVGDYVFVSVRFRDGTETFDTAGEFGWHIDGKNHPMGRHDIMAWRLYTPAKPARSRRPKVGAPEHVSRDKMTAAAPESATAFNTDHILLRPYHIPEAPGVIEEPTTTDDETKVGWILLISVLAAVLLVAIVGAYSHA